MEVLPADNEEYGTQAYWEARYSGPSGAEPFDWFKTWSELRDHVEPLLSGREARILMLGASSWKSCHEYVAKHYQQGCGNSALSQDMYDDGYHNICNIDFASSVIQSMREQHQDVRPQMEWREGDVRHMPDLLSESFDVAIDKGTMDAMMTRKHDVWNPPADMVENCRAEVSEALRLLKPDGIFIYITFAQPHFRKRMLTFEGYQVNTKTIGDGMSYFIMTVKRDGL